MKIFVGNLSWNATEDALRQLFEECGEVMSIRIVVDNFTGRSKGFGFVEMKDAAAGNQAIAKFNDFNFLGRPLRVSEARNEERSGTGPRGPRRQGPSSSSMHRGSGGGRSMGGGRSRFEENQYT